jgi:Fanconi anemia group M protein
MKRLLFLNYEKIEPRAYQENIATTAMQKNTLVVLPTGLGKTIIAIMVAAQRLQKYPKSKILMIAPSRPLVHQHMKTFKKLMTLDESKFIALTGKIRAENRKVLYQKGRAFFATPQVIKNDVENKILSLRDYSLLTVDECHRSVRRYPYTFVVNYYLKQSLYPLILGLTASPGGTIEKIEEIKRNLHVEAVEIRTEKDEDVKPYIQKTKRDWIYVKLPEEFKKIRNLLQECLNDRLQTIKATGLDLERETKGSLLKLQEKLGDAYAESGNWKIARALSLVAEAIKIEHGLELLETQGITPLHLYFTKLTEQKSRATKRMLNDPRIKEAINLTNELYARGSKHPKLKKLVNVIKDILRKNPKSKIIVFANYRSTIDEIKDFLTKNDITCEILIGQRKGIKNGLSQKEQIEILKRFANGEFNVLTCSSIGEEGLDIIATNVAIFYDEVGSAIRLIQRRGRVGRQIPGRVIHLLTEDTRDVSLYWASFHRERKMKGIIYDMKERTTKKRKSLLDWLK